MNTPPELKLTVAICTWNRAELLRRTLEGLTALQGEPGLWWEVLVVDNNSTDDTSAVLAEFSERLPLRALHEPKPGKSNAANLAVREARGDYLVWTDDDVIVDPEWLLGYAAAMRSHPDAVVFGGRIDPWFEGTPPRWLVDAFSLVAGVYAAVDLKRAGGIAPDDFFPLGANMALRREAHLAHPFDPRIGPQPGSTIRGEEWILVRDLKGEGAQVVWVPEARVRHFLPRERQRESYIRSWFHGHGELLGLMESSRSRLNLFGRPLWLWRQLVEHELRYRLGRFVLSPKQWLHSLTLTATAWGRLRSPRSPRTLVQAARVD